MSNKVVNATITAILAVGITGMGIKTFADQSPTLEKGMEKCYGVAKSGLNDCAYAGKSCSGTSKVDGEKDAWISVPKGTCNKIIGGSTKAPA